MFELLIGRPLTVSHRPLCINKDAVAGGEGTCPRSQSWLKGELRLESRLACGPLLVPSSIFTVVLRSCPESLFLLLSLGAGEQ